MERSDARGSAPRLPHHAPLASSRRQGDPAQEPESHLLPDQRRRPRSRPHRGRHAAARGLRLVLSVLSRSRAVPRAGDDPARDAAGRGRRRGRSELGRPADAVALGPPGAQHSVAGQPDRDAGAAGRRLRRGRDAVRAGAGHSRSRSEVPRRRSRLHVDRRRRDQRRRVLGSAQLGLHAHHAGAVHGRGQRLRHLGAGRGADRRRRHLEAGGVVPAPQDRALRRHRLPRQLPRGQRSGHLHPPRAQAGDGARQGDSPLLALALGRRAALQAGGRARGRSAARPAHPDARVPRRRRPGHRRRGRGDCGRGRCGGAGGHRRRAGRAEAGRRNRGLVCVLARRGSHVRRVRDARTAHRQARHDGRRRSTAR